MTFQATEEVHIYFLKWVISPVVNKKKKIRVPDGNWTHDLLSLVGRSNHWVTGRLVTSEHGVVFGESHKCAMCVGVCKP